jgi:hypothetical protein
VGDSKQPSAIGYQPSAINHQLEASGSYVRDGLSAMHVTASRSVR